MADGQVVFEIVGDKKGIDQTIKQVTGDIQNESKKWDQAAGQATKGIENSFDSMTKSVVAKLAAAGIGTILLNWGNAAVQAASDLAEVQNVVDTVFGDGAQKVESWAKAAGKQFGLTETQAKKFTSTLGAMMKSSGLAGSEIVDMSTDLAGLAADMASFYNLDFETAFEKIRSGISGETMPLKQLGINMSVANLNAFALAQGLEKTFDQMDQGEQTMLRYQYLMQATTDAQGDFAKTADGFANAQRRIQTAIDSITTIAGGFILHTVEPFITGIASMLESITTPPETTILDDFNAVEVDTTEKMAALEETYQKAQSIIDLLDKIGSETVTLNTGATISLADLFTDLGAIEANGGDITGYIESLGLDVDYVIQKYNVWKEATKQLTSTVPALTKVIDSETGAINGGTDALQENLDAWKKAEEKKLAWAKYYAMARALEEKKATLYQYEFAAGVADQAVKQQEQKIAALRQKMGFSDTYSGYIVHSSIVQPYSENEKEWNAALDMLAHLQEESKNATAEFERQTGAYATAEEYIAGVRQKTIEEYGEEEEAVEDLTDAVQELTDEEKAAIEAADQAASEALQALEDYVSGVKDATAQMVNSVIKGFGQIGKAGDDLRKKQGELAGEETDVLNEYAATWAKWGSSNEALKQMAASWDGLTDEEQAAYEALVKIRNAQHEVNDSLDQYRPETMEANLQSQIDYMEEYLQNLEKLQEWGISDELLASLSDGSQESAEYLAGLVSDGQEAAEAVDEMYGKVQEKKKEFTDALSSQKLAADEMYDALVNKALEAVAQLDMGSAATSAMESTVEGIAHGIENKEPEVAAAVDMVLRQINRLPGSVQIISGGMTGFLSSIGFGIDGEFETGLDRVPFDGFLASLHEGEGILTAEENRIWQRFKNGEAGHANVDYEALGGVMRENVKAGGNVYLDGRTVGHVVSGIQGQSYKNLQRSGWQG